MLLLSKNNIENLIKLCDFYAPVITILFIFSKKANDISNNISVNFVHLFLRPFPKSNIVQIIFNPNIDLLFLIKDIVNCKSDIIRITMIRENLNEKNLHIYYFYLSCFINNYCYNRFQYKILLFPRDLIQILTRKTKNHYYL